MTRSWTRPSSGRSRIVDAALLLETYGDNAGFEAAARAEASRDKGNVARFCHWRQIERVIVTLSDQEVRAQFTKIAPDLPARRRWRYPPCHARLAP